MRLALRENLLYLAVRLRKAFDRESITLGQLDPASVKRILVVSTTAFGDTVLSTAAIDAVRRRFPDAQLVGHFHHGMTSLFARLPGITQTIPYFGGWKQFFSTIRALRAAQCDVALILHGNEPQATPMAYLAGIRCIVKIPNTHRFGFLLANRETALHRDDYPNGFELRLAAARLLGARTDGARMSLPHDEADHRAVREKLAAAGVASDAPLVGLQVCASSKGRMWPAENFVALAQMHLRSAPGTRFILSGTPGEHAYCERIAQGIGNAAVNLAGKLPLTLLPALLAELRALVTGDTGTMHAAVAVGTPIVGLFAVSTPSISGPMQDREIHRCIHIPCPPGVRSKTEDQAWISRISVEAVADALRSVLTQARGRAS